MADLPQTGDISIVSNDGLHHAEVTTNDELSVLETNSADILLASKRVNWFQHNGMAFMATGSATLSSKDTQYDVFLIKNPAGSGKSFEIEYFEVSAITLTAGNYVRVRFYYNPTITTNGTAYTPFNAQLGNAATSGLEFYSAPTISNRGTLFGRMDAQLTTPYRQEENLGTAISPGGNALLTIEASSNGSIISFNMKFTSNPL